MRAELGVEYNYPVESSTLQRWYLWLPQLFRRFEIEVGVERSLERPGQVRASLYFSRTVRLSAKGQE